jgi:CspA family cold shock protein
LTKSSDIYLKCPASKLMLQFNKKVSMSIKGKVKWFNGTKGYGFIEREDKEKDVFVHMSAVKDSGVGYLDEGDSLTFEIEEGKKGPSAVNLKKE